MEILELELKHYGKFENHRLRLKPGMNIIYGSNETGKTTIHSFIRAMFFGLARGRGRVSRTDEYRLRQPWENPGYFAGSMRIREGKEIYSLERNFDRENQSLRVFNETRGSEAADGREAIDRILNGMSESAFCNTVFVRQARSETDEGLMEELQRFMVNYDRSLDQQTDVTKAVQSLRRKKKQFEQKKKAEEQLLEEQIGRRQTEADYLRREIENLRERERSVQQGNGDRTGAERGRQMVYGAGLEERNGGQAEYGNSAEEYGAEEGFEADASEKRSRTYQRLTEILLVVAALLSFAGAAFLQILQVRIFLGIFGIIFLLCLIPVHLLLGNTGDEEESDEEDSEEKEWRLGVIREDIRNREDKYQKLQKELEVLYQKHVKLEGINIEIEALTMAIERILSLSSDIFQESGGSLNEKASEILRQITGGRCSRVSIDEAMEVRVQASGRLLHLYEVSYGTMQQIYFALRMAAGEMLAGDRILPLVLDEPFAMYDDARLEAALTWLYCSGRQVILFTCQERERRILEKVKKKVEVRK